MGYPPEYRRLIKKVEETRPKRFEMKRRREDFPALTLRQREEVLRGYHPDYKEESRRRIHVGPEKGKLAYHEITDLLEARSRVDPDKFDLSQVAFETDVLVVGGGGAGASAALLAQEHGAKVVIATKLRMGDANTMMAEGGMQAVTKFGIDSPYFHYLDTMGGGHFENQPDLVYRLVTESPKVIEWFERLGVRFSKKPDGNFDAVHLGGSSRKRIHYSADITGAEIMRTLRDEVWNRKEGIQIIEFSPLVELVLNEYGHCAGAILYNLETEEYLVVRAKAVIMATGGSGRLHYRGFATTNHYGATADGVVVAYRAGVGFCFLENMQFHPTGAVFPEQLEGLLITEKFRGEGANLVNIDGEQFVFEREPRDVEAAVMIRECTDHGKGILTPTGKMAVWLDSPLLELIHGPGKVMRDFVGKWKIFMRHGIDISKEPMLVYPTHHYQNGGLRYNAEGETVLPGFYVAGEVGGGVHGGNRLGGNSLIDVFVFGRIAGVNAARYARECYKEGRLTLDHVRAYHNELKEAGIETDRLSPMILPNYTTSEVRKRQLTTHYLGTLR